MVKWVWDIDERICVNVATIKFLDIVEEDSRFILRAVVTDKMGITIAKSPDIGILKDKIRTIIAGG